MKRIILGLVALFIAISPEFSPITTTQAQEDTSSSCTMMTSFTYALLTLEPKAIICQFRLSVLTSRARNLAEQFDYSGGIERVNDALMLSPDNPMLYTLRGELTLLLYEWNNALEDFNTALSLDAAYAPAYFHRGVLHYTMTAYDMAFSDFEHYMALAPQGPFYDLAAQYSQQIDSELELQDN